jgi:hypothetical protein
MKFLRLAVLIPAIAFLPMVAAQNAKTDKDKADKPAFDEVKVRASVLNGKDGYVQGKLKMYDLDKREFTIQYDYQIKKANPEGQKKLRALEVQGRQALAQKNKQLFEQLQQQYQAAQAEAWNIQEFPIVFECVGEKNMTFRTLVPPQDPETGKAKKLTPAEEKQLKGNDPKEPGYIFDPKDIDNDMLVRIYIDKSKIKPDDKKDAKKDEKKDAKKDDKKEEKKDDKKETTTTKKVAVVKPEDKDKDKKDDKKDEKKDAKKDTEKGDKGEEEKVVYPIYRIVILPPPMEAGGGGAGNPFIKGK